MNTKKIMSFMLIGMLASCLLPSIFHGNVQGVADNDNFNVIMVGGGYLECNIINASWNIGIVEMSHHYWTNQTGETELADTHNSTAGVNLDFEMTVSVDAVTWNVGAAPGADTYQMNASSDSWVSQMKFQSAVYGDVKTDFAPATNASFDLRFDSPVSTTTGLQQTLTLNGKVTVH